MDETSSSNCSYGAVFILFHLFEGHGKLATAAMMYADEVWDERSKADATQKKGPWISCDGDCGGQACGHLVSTITC